MTHTPMSEDEAVCIMRDAECNTHIDITETYEQFCERLNRLRYRALQARQPEAPYKVGDTIDLIDPVPVLKNQLNAKRAENAIMRADLIKAKEALECVQRTYLSHLEWESCQRALASIAKYTSVGE